MIDQKTEKKSDTLSPDGTEDRENCRTCLYVNTKDAADLPTVISKCLSGLGFLVTTMTNIPVARKLCRSTHYSLVVLEDCRDKNFIKNIKGPATCNDDTPIMYISSDGKLPDLVKELTRERYIDEVVFRCSTVEGDLVRAVSRLTVHPGHCTVTFTRGKPSAEKKRKLEQERSAAAPPLRFWNRGEERTTSISAAASAAGEFPRPPISTLGCLPLSRSSPPPITGPRYTRDAGTARLGYPPLLYQPSLYESVGLQPLPAGLPGPAAGGGAWFGPAGEQHPLMYPATYQHALHAYYCFGDRSINAACPYRADGYVPMDATGSSKQLVGLSPDSADGTNPQEMTTDGEMMEAAPWKAQEACNKDDSATERKAATSDGLSKETRGSAADMNKALSSAELSKEHHLEKERRRRVRITKCWHWLRSMVPHCSEHADKATVFEMTVAYLHHCWKYHGPLLNRINEEFAKEIKNAGTPDDLEEIVSKTLAMEGETSPEAKSGAQNL